MKIKRERNVSHTVSLFSRRLQGVAGNEIVGAFLLTAPVSEIPKEKMKIYSLPRRFAHSKTLRISRYKQWSAVVKNLSRFTYSVK
jgi:hypothetical protein